jgi:RHS repeat-associated protein
MTAILDMLSRLGLIVGRKIHSDVPDSQMHNKSIISRVRRRTMLAALVAGLLPCAHVYALVSSEPLSEDGSYTISTNKKAELEAQNPDIRIDSYSLTETYMNPVGPPTATQLGSRVSYVATGKAAGVYNYSFQIAWTIVVNGVGVYGGTASESTTVRVVSQGDLTQVKGLDRYEIYYGDINSDGKDGDIYLHGKDLFVLIAGDINIPLLLQGPPGILYAKTTEGHSVAQAFSLNKSQLVQYLKAQEGRDYAIGDINKDGKQDLAIRGKQSGMTGLVLMSSANLAYPAQQQFVTTATVAGEVLDYMDRSRQIRLADKNGDGVLDISLWKDDHFNASWDLISSAAGLVTFSPTFDKRPLYQPATLVGSSDGNFRVTEQGAATYIMPISVPAGTAGVVPSVSLSYSSQAGNDIAGYGWSLGAYSAIRRCPKSLSHDGKSEPLKLDDQDALCLDGSRLIQSGSYLRTELDSYVRVKKQSDYYTVEGKDGSIKFYGKNAAERQIAADGKIIQWALNKACDSIGNCIDYKYEQVNTLPNKGSDFRLTQIAYAYGGSTLTNANALVDFVYENEDRGDSSRVFVAGNPILSTKRLKEIQVKSRLNSGLGFSELRRYALQYKRHSPADPYIRSYLDGIQECVGGDCLPETRFTWVHNGSDEFDTASWDGTMLFEAGHSFMGDFVPLDVNGDGYMDIAWVENDHEHGNDHHNGYVRYAFYDPVTKGYVRGPFSDGSLYRYISGAGASVANESGWIRLQALDYNADGRMDLALYSNGFNRWQIHYAVPYGNSWRLARDGIWVSNIGVSTTMLDVDSDGLMDILNYGSLYNLKTTPTGSSIDLPYSYQKSTPNPTWTFTAKPFTIDPATPIFDPISNDTIRIVPRLSKKLLSAGDLNGDGSADVLLIDRKAAIKEFFSTASDPAEWVYRDCTYVEEHYYAMLNNGNGLSFTEFAYLGSAKELNPNPTRCGTESDTAPMLSIQVPNLNNDAYTDLVIRSGSDFYYFLNHGKGFSNASILEVASPPEVEGKTIQKYKLVGGVLLASFNTESDAKGAYINFADINNDGFGDFVKGVPSAQYSSYYYYQNWLPNENRFSSLSPNVKMPLFTNTNRYFFLDATGDGHLDYLRVYNDNRMQLVPNKATGLNNLITDIKNGLGANTKIQYEMLTQSANYQSIEDRLALEQLDYNADGQPYTYLSSNPVANPLNNYYPIIRNPFSGPLTKEQTFVSKFSSPVFEYMAPVNLVTKVIGDAPSSIAAYGQYNSFNAATKAEVEYYYGSARIQAGGRGFLGFRYVATKDPQSGVMVETRYRQDWPFVGVPETTITYAPVISTVKPTHNLANVYAQSIKHDQHKLQNWVSSWPGSANVTNGTAALGPMKIYLDRSEEVSFQFSSNTSTPTAITPTLVSGGNWCSTYADSAGCKLFPKTTTQAVLQRNVTTQVYDAENNPTNITVVTQGPGLKQTQKTDNDFGTSETLTLPTVNSTTRAAATYKELGRLKSATVTTTQERTGQTTVTDIKKSTFTYFTSGKFTGLLEKEIAFAGLGDEFEQASIYAYDTFGNKNSISTQAKKITYSQAGTRTVGALESRKARTEYDLTGRYLEKTYKNFGDVLGDKLLEQVTARAANGAPTSMRSDLNTLVATIEYDVLGREIGRSSNVGGDAWSETDYLLCNSSLACPPGTAFVVEKRGSDGSLARAYTDILGRTTRETAKNFQGDMVHVDTQYDLLGRVIRTSQPYKVNTSALYWTENQYDVLGRVIETRAPDAGINTFRYNGYTTVATNALLFNKTEVRNGFGELIEVKDHLGGRLEYVYNTRSQLEKVIKYRPQTDTVYPDVTGPVTTLIEYDVTGRKTKMTDADKGAWEYKYNAFGELLWQRDGKGQVQLQNYDELGRLSTRTDYKADATVESHTRWYYDGRTETSGTALTIANAIGQVSSVVIADRVTPGTAACSLDNGARQCNLVEFDSFGRAYQTTTQLFADGKFLGSYKSKVMYDSFGRVSEEYDVLNDMVKTATGTPVTNSGTRNHYSLINGELEKVIDMASNVEVYKILEKSVRGQPAKVLYGNGLTTQYSYHDDTGLTNSIKTFNSLNNWLQDQAYKWDKGANLTWRTNKGLDTTGAARSVLESFCYDGLNRLVRAYRGTTTGGCGATPSGGTDVSINVYDSLGNIREKYTRHNYANSTAKTGFSSYQYGAAASGGYATYAGPHAVTRTVNIANNAVVRYKYDQNGNMTQDEDGRSIAYSTYDMPVQITKGTHNTWFAYGVDRGRYWRKDALGSKTVETLYLGNVERITQGTTVIWKRYVAGVALYETKTDTNNQTLSGTATYRSYMHKDHLGSLDVITNDAGQPPPVEALGFDSWGERRNPATAKEYTAAELVAFANAGRPITDRPNYSVFAQFEPQRTNRGYTGHEMLDESGIIHMNGRIYDPTLGRFLQADPFIQASTNTQSYNRYTYVFNNPLNGVDPSGFISSGFYEFKRAFGFIAAVAYSIYCWGTCSAAAFAFIAAMGAAVNGADGKGVLIAAVAAYAGAQVGSFKALADKVIYAGVVGGVSAILTGGKFGHSFVASGIGAYFGAADWAVEIDSALARVGLAAVVGGTASELTGGKFKNGAGTSAFMAIVSMAADRDSESGSSGLGDIENGPLAENGNEGQATFDQALVEANRNGVKKYLLLEVEYKDVYAVGKVVDTQTDGTPAGVDSTPIIFAADKFQEAMTLVKNNPGEYGILNGVTSPKTGKITVYRSATHARNLKEWGRDHLGKRVVIGEEEGKYTNVENAIHVISHEVYHRINDIQMRSGFDHSKAYGEGHQNVLQYRRRMLDAEK